MRFMPIIVAILSATLCFLAATAASAGDNPLLGTWKLKSFLREVAATGERYNERGDHPNGYISYAADGRMYAIITWDNRANPKDVVPTNEERLRLYATMISYTGTYTVDAEKVLHHVDISWNQIWTGTDQIRFYKLDGNLLTITSAPNRNPVDGREGRSILVFEKIP
jgi:Lipocalin-like domain